MSAQGEGPIDYAIGNGERLLGVLESAMDPGAVAAARDTIAAARSELSALRARVAELEGRGAKPEPVCRDFPQTLIVSQTEIDTARAHGKRLSSGGGMDFVEWDGRIYAMRAAHDRKNTGDGGNTDAAAAIHARTTEDVERPSPAFPASLDATRDRMWAEAGIPGMDEPAQPAPASERWTEEQRDDASDIASVCMGESDAAQIGAFSPMMDALCTAIAARAPKFVGPVRLPDVEHVRWDDGEVERIRKESRIVERAACVAALRAQGFEVIP